MIKTDLETAVLNQRRWMEKCGGDLLGYIVNYGSKNDPQHYGDGGEAIYAADTAHLDWLEKSRGREVDPFTWAQQMALADVRRDAKFNRATKGKPRMGIDIKKFHTSIVEDVSANALRFKFTKEEDFLHGTAVLVSALVQLREHARIKPITADDVQVAIDTYMDKLGVAERDLPMGGTEFFKKPKVT